jgi:hypothetical protein
MFFICKLPLGSVKLEMENQLFIKKTTSKKREFINETFYIMFVYFMFGLGKMPVKKYLKLQFIIWRLEQ